MDNNYSITADFDAIPPNEVSYQLLSNPSGQVFSLMIPKREFGMSNQICIKE